MTQKPDEVLAKGMADIERKMGLDPLHILLARRQEYVEQAADLRAKYGSFGTFDAMRKSRLSTIKMECRARAVAESRKVTESYLDDEAHADGRYIDIITEATNARAELTIVDAHIEAIDMIIQRANAVARYLTAEMHL